MKKPLLAIALVSALVSLLVLVRCQGSGSPGSAPAPPAPSQTRQDPVQVDWPAFRSFLAPHEPTLIRGAMIGTPGSRTLGRAWESRGAFIHTGNPNRLLMFLFEADPALGQPVMQIRLTFPVRNALGMTLPQEGTPLIVVNFDRDTTAVMFRDGLPDALVDAIMKEADTNGWVPQPPATGGPPVEIDPAPFLKGPTE